VYAEPAQRVERCERIALQQKNRFGDFDLQAIGRQPATDVKAMLTSVGQTIETTYQKRKRN
jgi:hypothetical protein